MSSYTGFVAEVGDAVLAGRPLIDRGGAEEVVVVSPERGVVSCFSLDVPYRPIQLFLPVSY